MKRVARLARQSHSKSPHQAHVMRNLYRSLEFTDHQREDCNRHLAYSPGILCDVPVTSIIKRVDSGGMRV